MYIYMYTFHEINTTVTFSLHFCVSFSLRSNTLLALLARIEKLLLYKEEEYAAGKKEKIIEQQEHPPPVAEHCRIEISLEKSSSYVAFGAVSTAIITPAKTHERNHWSVETEASTFLCPM